MRIIGWISIIISVVLLGYLFYNLALNRRQQARPIAYEVSADSVKVYQERISELESRSAAFREAAKNANVMQKLVMERQLNLLDQRIRDLKVAVEQWKSSREQPSGADLYTKCVLLYGQASGVCDALKENEGQKK